MKVCFVGFVWFWSVRCGSGEYHISTAVGTLSFGSSTASVSSPRGWVSILRDSCVLCWAGLFPNAMLTGFILRLFLSLFHIFFDFGRRAFVG